MTLRAEMNIQMYMTKYNHELQDQQTVKLRSAPELPTIDKVVFSTKHVLLSF